MREILIGTSNPSKLRRLTGYFSGTGVICRSPVELGVTCVCAEDAFSAEGNAIEKALAWHQASGLPVFAEDSGLVLLDLPPNHPDQPGVHVRRIQGQTLDDAAMLDYYQQLIRKHGGQLRAAWQDGNCLLKDDTHWDTYVELSAATFLLKAEPNGIVHPGWPLDSISYPLEDSAAQANKHAAYIAALKRWISQWVERFLQNDEISQK